MPSTKETYNQLINDLRLIYDLREAESLAARLLESIGTSKTQILADSAPELSPQNLDWLETCIQRLQKHEPIQYILGYAPFYGLDFKVNKQVLIPRPETEELVDLIIRENTGSPKILDIGTGSGCIAISLKKAFPTSTIRACDNSPESLEVAKKNAFQHDVQIQFYEKDVLHIASIPDHCDIIVSNPPYVIEYEKTSMESNVLDFEPANSLFVSNNDPLVFYTAIIELASRNLNPDGKLYLEINESKGVEVKILMTAAGFDEVRILQDLNGRDRFATGIKRDAKS